MNLRLLAYWSPERMTYGEYKKWILDRLTLHVDLTTPAEPASAAVD